MSSEQFVSYHTILLVSPQPGSHSCMDDGEDVEDPDSSMMHCIEHWRNAGSEAQKKMFKVFNELGIFIACCHHCFVLVACDMVQSGEL